MATGGSEFPLTCPPASADEKGAGAACRERGTKSKPHRQTALATTQDEVVDSCDRSSPSVALDASTRRPGVTGAAGLARPARDAPSPSDLFALPAWFYAAIPGVLALAWQIWAWRQERRTRLEIFFGRLAATWRGTDPVELEIIEIVNHSRRDV